MPTKKRRRFEIRKKTKRALKISGPESRFFKALKSGDSIALQDSLNVLTAKKNRRIFPHVGNLLSHQSPLVRSSALRYFSGLSLVESLPLVRAAFRDKSVGVVKTAGFCIGKLTYLKNKKFFDSIFSLAGKEIKRPAYSVLLKRSHVFPDKWNWGPNDHPGAGVLQISLSGKPICMLGFQGNVVHFLQGFPGRGPVGQYFEVAVDEYLKLVREMVSKENPVYFLMDDAYPHYRGIRDRYCDKFGVLNFNRERVKRIFEKK